MLWPILRKAFVHPRRVAVVDDQRSYRYLDLVGGAFHLARHIKRTTDNPRVGVLLPTSGLFPIATLATWMLGRTIVPINYLLGEAEREYIIRDSGIDTVVTADRFLEALDNYDPPHVKRIALDKLAFKGVPPVRCPAVAKTGDVAVVLYTSGTSGKPKGVMLTHGNLRSNVDGAIEHAGIRAANGFLGVLPQFHSMGLTALTLLPLRVGAPVVYTARFIPRRLVQLIAEHRPEIVIAIPSMYNALLTVKKATPDDFKSVKYAVSGGEPLPQAVFDNFQERYGVKILEGYGLTETSPVAAWSTPQKWKHKSVGRLLPGVGVKIIDDEGREQPVGGEGEIWIKGPNIMAGYHNLPDQTREVLDDAGYFRSGDWGKIDADGYLYITGRKKEMLIIGGENVFPREIEEVINKHESVKDSAVVGKMDETRGEVPVAFVELHEGAEFDEPGLRKYCRENMPQFKVPREIRCVDALPRNPTGKILRRELQERLKAEGQSQP